MAVTEEQRKQNQKVMNIYLSAIIAVVMAYLFGYAGSIKAAENIGFLDAALAVTNRLSKAKFLYTINTEAVVGMAVGLVVGALIGFMMILDNQRNVAYKADEVAGTGGFMPQKELKAYNQQYILIDGIKSIDDFSTMIMSDKFRRPIDSRILIGNNNVMVVGAAGTGKSRYLIKPNILQLNASYVITDPSGEMIFSMGNVLKENGYKIKIFNISDMRHSNCYNPLHYIRDEAGVNMLIKCFIANTTQGEAGGDNQFFVDAERLLYSACIFYLIDFCHDESRKNFASVMNMINASSVNENDPSAKSPLDKLFDSLPQNSLAWKYYKAFKQAAGKTLKSIIISCVTRLQPFMTPQVVNLTKTDTLELEKIGDEKTALFIITPQADRTYSFLASMLYSQFFETLYYKGEQQKAAGGDERMKVPVRCLMDEFANIGEVPEFPSKLSTMRKYNISATIILQDIAQIEAMYKDNWKTLVGNCSTFIFLGTQEINTLKYFSEMLGKKTIRNRSNSISNGGKGGSSKSFQQTGREVMTPDELGRMDSKECIVFTQNMRPVYDAKYRYERHPRYDLTADADNSRGFQYNTMSIYDNTRPVSLNSIIKAKQEAARFRRTLDDPNKSGGTTDPKSAEKEIMEGDLNSNVNKFEADEKIEEMTYSYYANQCLEAAADCKSKICVIKLDHVPCKHLQKLVAQTSAMLGLSQLIIFTDVHSKDNLIVGLALDKRNSGQLFEALESPYLKYKSVSGNMMTMVINGNTYDKYISQIA